MPATAQADAWRRLHRGRLCGQILARESELGLAVLLADLGGICFAVSRQRGERGSRQHVGQALRQRLKAAATIELLGRIVGAHREFDDRAAEIMSESSNPRG